MKNIHAILTIIVLMSSCAPVPKNTAPAGPGSTIDQESMAKAAQRASSELSQFQGLKLPAIINGFAKNALYLVVCDVNSKNKSYYVPVANPTLQAPDDVNCQALSATVYFPYYLDESTESRCRSQTLEICPGATTPMSVRADFDISGNLSAFKIVE